MTTGRSILVLGRYRRRRLAAADAFRGEGAVVVEAATVHRVDAILKQLRFDVLAVDSFGMGVGVIQLVHDLGVDHPDLSISVLSPIIESQNFAWSYGSHLPHRAKNDLDRGTESTICEAASDRQLETNPRWAATRENRCSGRKVRGRASKGVA